MREEKISYLPGLPLAFSLMRVENWPLHWHNAIELIFVLEGKLEIEIGTGFYGVEAGELEIVNPNEIHSIRSVAGENLLLLLHIHPDFFEQYYEGARDVFYYADSSERKIQQSPRYETLRNYISLLFYEAISQRENYKEEMEQRLLDMMYFLLNNFHYLFYEEESLRDDDYERERYHRIVRYISDNYMEKVSLQEIAQQEFLTSQYLSYKIKNTFGYGFTDFLNHTRVEESLKLLLDSDLNISEIAEEVGFSHVRYYNRHFRLHYNKSPMEYRKEFRVSAEELKRITKVESLPLENALPYLTQYLETYERYEYDDRIHRYDIDLCHEPLRELHYGTTVNLGSGEEILTYRYDDSLSEKICTLQFESGIIERLEGAFPPKEEGGQINWHFVDNILDYLQFLGLKPIFFVDEYEDSLEELKDYLETNRRDLPLSEIRFVKEQDFYQEQKPLFEGTTKENDTLSRVGDVLQRNLQKPYRVPRMIDSYQSTILESDTFYGGEGLLTFSGLKKPSYYSYFFLSQLGQQILYEEEGLLVTQSENGFEILLSVPPVPKKERRSYLGQRKRFSLNLSNLHQDYRVIRYELNQDSGSAYEKWCYLGCPQVLSEEYRAVLELAAIPEIKFYYGGKNPVYHIFTTVKDRGATLYLFRMV